MKRRTFLTRSMYAAGTLLISPAMLTSCSARSSGKSIGIQLYSLRDIIFKDLRGTLEKVASFGYTEVETFSYGDGKIFNRPFSEFVSICNDIGLKITSGHYLTGFNLNTSGNMRNGWEKAVEDAKNAGQAYMVIAYLFEGERQTIDDYRRLCEQMNRAGEVCKSYGIRLGYHNHAFEFEMLEDKVPYDVMLEELDPKLVCMEMDLYWVVRAGKSPETYFEKNPGRFELWHVKDMHRDDPDKNADLGSGRIDFPSIFQRARQAGLKHFYVEQETYDVSSLTSAENNFRYMKNIAP